MEEGGFALKKMGALVYYDLVCGRHIFGVRALLVDTLQKGGCVEQKKSVAGNGPAVAVPAMSDHHALPTARHSLPCRTAHHATTGPWRVV